MKHKLHKKATEVFIGLGNGKKLLFEFQRKQSVGGIAKKRYLHFTRRKKAIVARVEDNKLTKSHRYLHHKKRVLIFPLSLQRCLIDLRGYYGKYSH